MRFLIDILLTSVVCLVCLVNGQVNGQAFQNLPQRYFWQQIEGNPDQWALMDLSRPFNSRQVGVYVLSKDEYSPLIEEHWGIPEEPPALAGLPPGCQHKALPTGVISSRITKGDHVYHNGEEISKEQALALLAGKAAYEVSKKSVGAEGDSRIPDDTKKIRVSVIGSEVACKEPLELAKKYPGLLVVDYRPDDWMIKRQGFVVLADPTIYIQEPGEKGKVVRRLDGWLGAEKFTEVLQEITSISQQAERRVAPNPDYDPNKDEGWYKRIIIPALEGFPWIPAATVGSFVVFALWSRRKKIA